MKAKTLEATNVSKMLNGKIILKLKNLDAKILQFGITKSPT